MAMYIAAQLTIHDQARYEVYARRFASSLAGFDGRLLVADDRPEVLSGAWAHDKFVLLRFAGTETAVAWANSDAYRRIAPDREIAAETTALMLRGLR